MTLVTLYGPGEAPLLEDVEPGDLLLLHRVGLASSLIAVGQRRRFGAADARWTHVACVETSAGGLVEALGRGVQRSHIDKYRSVEYLLVGVQAWKRDREQMQAFLSACVGRPYGWVEIVSLGVSLAAGGDWVGLSSPGTLICSALAAQMLTRAGVVFERDPNRMMPGDLARWAASC